MIMSEKDLMKLGAEIAQYLKPGAVVALSGDLGSGKTMLTKAIAEGLGVTDHVTSPTFTIINEYGGGRLPLYHFDVYRLDGSDAYEELDNLGWEDYFYGDGVCVVEWADMVEDIIPSNAVRFRLSGTESPNHREVVLL
ncbi:MAG: tRNA (adenosine(37)-N6)-threonylcarbamoyltransferase complex ATPase subunit type 1 TsaE [Clostridiales Family XIII bacterium]|jgi:tRNA threonylcarbamoyladenosine biosynthesis protein TsaE|nr:tRNA (adenosine(37)-N6)-threonylcarbamoyltransferase complex ATPase subunit type 1 TsaE [Clostridiales Family XIII bacterium]